MSKLKKSLALIITAIFLVSTFSGFKMASKKAGPVKLIWYYVGSKQPDEQKVYDKINEILQKKINATVDFRCIDWGAYDEKMKLIISGQEEYDVCFTASWINNFSQNVAKGAFVDMNPLINKYTPELRKQVPSTVFKPGVVDGKLYGLSNYQMNFNQSAFYMTKKIADKYGINSGAIKKYEDIAKFLPKIKAGNPELYTIKPGYERFMEWEENINGTPCYIDPRETSYRVYGPGDGKALKAEDAVKFQLMLRDWARKGFLRKDIATLKDDTADINALKYAIWSGPIAPGWQQPAKAKYKTDIIGIPFTKPYLKMNAGIETLNAISQTSKHPDLAMKVIALLNTDKELYNLLCYGIEGVHYTKSGKFVDVPKDSKYAPGINWEFGNTFNAYLLKGTDPNTNNEIEYLNKTAKASKLMGFVANLDKIKNQAAQVGAADQEFWGREYLDLNDDAKFFAMKQEQRDKLIKAGSKEIIAEIQKQVDKFVKDNKLK